MSTKFKHYSPSLRTDIGSATTVNFNKRTIITSLKAHADISSPEDETSSSLTVEYEEILTSEEAAKYLKLSIGSLRNMTSNGLIPYQKLGGRNRYFKEDLRNLLLANRRGGSNGN